MTYLCWLRLLYVITDEEIYVKYGLISRDITQVRLDRENTAYDQSILERVLSFGDV
ncbi:PH domain-containing protein [Natronococcus wangiae]|uniref:PH domain-containing protein n=1 Tax=Natronococcus wangiae TaxID=3068275 RepID=UPI00273F9B57|nr:PH domain-containing protein [Natronococcus sp. AD5]